MPTAPKSVAQIKAELAAVRAQKAKPERQSKSWFGLIFCDDNGYASIVGPELHGIWLGKTSEIIPYLKRKGIDGEYVDTVLQAVQDFRAEQKEGFKTDPRGPSEAKNRGSGALSVC